jgi:hypothetical protein
MNGIAIKAALVIAACAVAASGLAETMDREIDYLLATVGNSECTFIRNGKSYPATKAQEHLQMKRERGKRHFDSADEFIEKIASKSSFSGKPYLIQCDDEARQPAAEWFAALLTQHRENTAE